MTHEADDYLDMTKTDAEVDAMLRADGLDPEALRTDGAKIAIRALTDANEALRTENAALKARAERIEAAAREVCEQGVSCIATFRRIERLRAALEEP